jgi:uncharacterized membrane protein
MDNINPVILLPLLCGAIFSIFGLVIYKFPPKLKNGYYGYRSNRSKKTKETWDFAQNYSSKLMIIAGLILCGTSSIGLFFKPTEETGILIGLALVLASVFSVLFLTEVALKKKFQAKQ